MYIPTSLLALFALTAQPLLAAKLTITIGSNELLPSAAALLPTTRARLSSPSSRHTASLSPSNSFHLSNLTAGSYLFTIHALDFDFTPLRIDIEQTAGGEELVEAAATFRQNDWGHRGEILGRARGSTKGEEAHLQFTVKALRRREYYEPRPAFNPIDLLKNPMILIGALGLGAVVLMPKLLDNMDPEVLEEMDRAKPTGGKDAAAANPLAGFDPAAWLAGTNQKPPAGNAITSGSSGPKFKVAGGGGGGTQRKRRDW